MSKQTAARFDDPIEPIKLKIGGKTRMFDIDDPELPDWIGDAALQAGGYPHDKRLKRKQYEKTLALLQIELVKLQYWLQKSGERVMVLFEGRDAAGKGGTIFVTRQYMNPRTARNVALTKPTGTEAGQWYFQRYVAHFPTAGEFVTFDRSWYNRAGVEPVMGFCTPQQHEKFLGEVPHFERGIVSDGIRFFKIWLSIGQETMPLSKWGIVSDGIRFFKIWLSIGQETQLLRFHDRRHSALKRWKFSPIDVAGMTKWDDYTAARDQMFDRTHTEHAPWTVVRANDKRRARLAVIRRLLLAIPYDGRDLEAIGEEDEKVIGAPSEALG